MWARITVPRERASAARGPTAQPGDPLLALVLEVSALC